MAVVAVSCAAPLIRLTTAAPLTVAFWRVFLAAAGAWLVLLILRSGTRREELLLDENNLQKIWLMRRMANLVAANSQSPTEATERILERMSKTASNKEFLATLAKEI